MVFEIVGGILHVETIATGRRIRRLGELVRRHGRGHWMKRKGVARVRLGDGAIRIAEVHWYEATGIGKRDFKIKQMLD